MSENISDASIKVGIDATGVEVGLRKIEEGAAKTGKTLDSLGKSDGFNKLADGAETAAGKFASGSKGIVSAIEKRTAAMELGKRGTVEYYTALANQKGINPALLQPYLDKLQAVTRATQEAAEAQRRASDGASFIEGLRARAAEIGKSASELAAMRAAELGVTDAAGPLIEKLRESEEAAGGLSGALGITTGAVGAFLAGLAGAVSIGGFVAAVKGAIGILADLDDMSQKTGASVEVLSRLKKIADMTGQDFGQVDAALVKLAKGMGGLDEDSNKVNSALKRLGVSSKDAAGQLRDPGEVMIDAAKALQQYGDGARKTAIINDLLSKSGADLLPYLNDVSEGIDSVTGSSKQSAALASAFGDNLGVMRVRVGEMANVIAVNLLPYLVQFSEYIKEVANSDRFKQFLADAGAAAKAFGKFVAESYTIIVPAAKITAAYFALFVGVPALIGAVSTVMGVLYGVVGAGVTKLIASGSATAALNTALWGTSLSATAAEGAMGKLKIAGGVLFAAFAGWQVGTYLRENFVEARVAGLSFVGAMLTGWENLKFGAKVAWEAIGFAWDTTINGMKLVFANYLSGVQKGLATVGAEKTAREIGEYVDSMRAAVAAQGTFESRIAGTRAAHEAELAAIEKNITGMVAYELSLENVADAKEKANAPLKKPPPPPPSGGDKAAAAKEAATYASLIAGIKEKIAANNLELATEGALSESQKLSIKLDQELASGKLVLTSAHAASARAALGELAAMEQLVKGQKAQKDVLDEIFKSTISRNDLKDSLEVEYAMYGKTADAREAALVAVKAEADMQKFLAAERKAGIPITDEMLQQLARERDMLVDVTQATMGQRKALGYAASLAEQNRKFAAESIFDERERARKLLEIEAETWEERIRLAGAGTEAQKVLRAEYDKWYENQLQKPMKDEWRKSVEKYSDVFRNGFADMLNNGRDGWKSFTKSLTTTFKTSVADQIYKMFAQPFVVRVVASLIGVTGSGAAAAGTSAGPGGAMDIISQAKQAYQAISSGFDGLSTSVADGVQAGLNATGLSSNILTNGPVANAAGQFAGMAAGYTAGSSLNKAISGGYETGSGVMKVQQVATAVASYFGPQFGAIAGAISGLVNRAFGMKEKVVGESSIVGNFGMSGFAGSTDTPWTQKGGWFRSNKSGVEKTAVESSVTQQFTGAYDSIKLASADFAKTLGLNADAIKGRTQQVKIALTKDQAANEKAIADFFTGVANAIAVELLPNLAAFAKQGEESAATLQRIAGNYAFLDVAMASIGKTFGAAGVSSVAARERLVDLVGGLDALGKGTAFFAQNFLTEAERIAPVAAQVTATLAGLGLSFVDTRDEFKQVVLGLDLTSSSGQATYAALMKVQEGFAHVYQAAEQANNALTERIELQKEYDELTLTAGQQLAKQRAALAPSNRGLFDQIQGMKALKAAQDAARSSLDAVTGRMSSLASSSRALGKDLLLGELSTLTPEQQYAEAKRQYESTFIAAKGGDEGAQDRFASIATTFLEASQKINGGDSIYASDFAGVLKTSDELAKWADGQVDVAKASLDALTAQVDALGQLNTSMLVVVDTLTGGKGALIPPPPRPFSDGPNYTAMGTLDMAPMAAEIKALREQVQVQTQKADQNAAALIESNAKVTMLAARLGADGMERAMVNQAWAKDSKVKLA